MYISIFCITFVTEKEIVYGMSELKLKKADAMIIKTRQGSREDLGRPTKSPIENKNEMMKKLGVK